MVEIAVAHQVTPFISVYPWSDAGYGVKFANPATLPASTGNAVAYTTANDAIAVAHSTTPFASVYPWSITGFGVKFANPATLPASTGMGVAFTDADDAVAVAHSGTPFITVYPWSVAGFGVKVANPGTLPANTGQGVAFTNADDAVALGHSTTPFIAAYPWSGTFGAKFANPATLPPQVVSGVDYTAADDFLAAGHNTTPFITVYPWSGAGFGAKVANPGTLPTGTGNEPSFTTADDFLALAHGITPFVSVYPWSGTFGAKVANPATLPASTGNYAAFTLADDALAIAHGDSPFVSSYPWSGVFGVKFANPGTLPAGNAEGVAFASTQPPPVVWEDPTPTLVTILAAETARRRTAAFQALMEGTRRDYELMVPGEIDPVENVAIVVIGGDCDTDATQLPGFTLTWDEVVPPSGTSFISYDIMRRIAGETDFTRIALVTPITTTTFSDFCVTSRVTYEYSVRWRATSGGSQVTSADTDPPVRGLVAFAYLFLHLEKDASVFVRLDSFRADKRRLSDRRQLAVRGRTKPTVAIGEQIWHQLRIPGLPQLLDARKGVWAALLTLMDEEREQSSVVCVRFGRARELYFCNTLQETQRQAQKTYAPDLTLVQVHFDEAV